MPRQPLPHTVSPVRMLRALRDEPGLVALFGDWVHGETVIGFRPTRVLGPHEDPFAALGAGDAANAPTDATHPARFGGGWIGYLGYQLSRRLESLPPAPPHDGGLPDHHLAHYDHVLVHDAATGQWSCESLPGADPSRVARTLATVDRTLAPDPATSSGPYLPREYRCEPFQATVTGAAHARAVRRALAHIRDGDIFQANICRELTAGFHGDPLDLFCAGYERLRPRFAAFLRTPGGAVASLSPELYLRRTGDAVLTSPIKGTAPADTDPAELQASAKNRAENVMIVDLMRNDLSRACVPGSVLSPAVPRVEPHTGVHHLVADVHGTLRPELDDAALLRATFPPGSCTGAPKIRAMEIINDLETTARGVYTGGVGYVSPVAGLALNVAIRTFEFSCATVRLGVGGGIVADSDPLGEAFETLVKAAPLLDAVGAAFGEGLGREWWEHTEREGGGTAIPACVSPNHPDRAGRPEPRRPSGGSDDAVSEGSCHVMSPQHRTSGRDEYAPAVHGVSVVDRTPDVSLGVFTTMLVQQGRPEHLRRHLVRLTASVRECYGAVLPDAVLPDTVAQRVLELSADLQGPHRLRVTVVPARQETPVSTAPNPSAAVLSVPGVLDVHVTSAPLNPPGAEPPVQPWELIPIVVPGGWGAHKWADRRALDTAPGPWSPVCDPLLLDRDGTVLETGRANIFAVFHDTVVTPALDGRILPGTMRAQVLDVLRAAGHEVREGPLAIMRCGAASEVFVTNALRGARPVAMIRSVGRWDTGPVTRWVQRLLGGRS